MPFKGVDRNAFRKAGKAKCKSKKERSKIYYAQKAKNLAKKQSKNKKRSVVKDGIKQFFTPSTQPRSSRLRRNANNKRISNKPIRSKTVNEKITIFDYIRTSRSPKLISSFSNGLATTLIGLIPADMSNKEYNYIRSGIALITSEILNRIFEEEIKTAERIKLFYKIGKKIYEVTVYVNGKLDELDYKRFKRVSKFDRTYRKFIKDNPRIQQLYHKDNMLVCLTKEEIEKGKVCPRKVLLERITDIKREDNTPNGCPYYNYCSKQ
ncbi:MAG: hypothetical protein IJ400_00635 [Clostridia bacterium]|nr:hypothetical protein [Clostridia bacterium]